MNSRNQYNATPGQTVFTYTFKILEATDLKVFKTPYLAEPNDANQILIYPADYTVIGINDPNGGTIVLNIGASSGDVITIQGASPIERATAFTPGGLIRAEDLNIEFDNTTLIQQQTATTLNDLVPKYQGAAIVAPVDTNLPMLLPLSTWRMNADRTAIENVVIPTEELVSELRDELASHDANQGASMVGLRNQTNVTDKTVQDLANSSFIVQTKNGSTENGQALGELSSGILRNETATGQLSISLNLTSIDSLAPTGNEIIYSIGPNLFALTALSAFMRTLLDDITATEARVTLGLEIGTDIQAHSDKLDALAAQTWAQDRITYQTDEDSVDTTPLTPFARTILDDTTAVEVTTTIGALPIAGGTMTGDLILDHDPIQDLEASTKRYVDNAVAAAGLQFTADVATIANLNWTYTNGTAGVGARLSAPGVGTVIIDDVPLTFGLAVLVKNQTNTFENGLYSCVNDGSATPALLERRTDYDTAAEILPGSLINVIGGQINGNSSYRETATVTNVGTDPILFSPYTINPDKFLRVENNLSDVASASAARTNLGLAIGTNVQAFNTYVDAVYKNELQMNRNVIIGGNFTTNPWQRGTSFAGAGADGNASADRFRLRKSGSGVFTFSKAIDDGPPIALSNVFSKDSLKMEVTTAVASLPASDHYALGYLVEGYDFTMVAQKPMTLSFYVKASVAGNFSVQLSNDDNTQVIVLPYTINAANTWQKIVINIPATPTAGTWLYGGAVGLRINFMIGVGSNFVTATTNAWQGVGSPVYGIAGQANLLATVGNTFQIGLIQLETGNVATKFDNIHFSDVLRKCQRYFWKTFGNGVTPITNAGTSGALVWHSPQAAGGGIISPIINFPAIMNTTPSITFYNPGANNAQARNWSQGLDATSTQVVNSGNWGFALSHVVPAGSTAYSGFFVHATAVAELI